MCGRYGIAKPNKIYDRFELISDIIDLKPKFNAAPSDWMPVIFKDKDGKNRVEMMRWGFIPAWAKDPKIANMTINARAETVHQKPSYQKPLKYQRCIIPVTHFFEWKQTSEGKVPYVIRLKDQEIFAFAGLFDTNDKAYGKEIKTFTIITTEPNELVAPIHNRMPVILKRSTENIWLDPTITDSEKALSFLQPFPANLMEAYAVFSEVNDPANDHPDIIKPVQ